MDIHCRFCGEPWDHDELHNMRDFLALGPVISYTEAGTNFRKYGCGAFERFGVEKCSNNVCDPIAAEAAAWSHNVFEYPEEWS